MTPRTAMHFFLREMSIAVDSGKCLDIEQVKEHMEKRDLVEWLRKELADVKGVNLGPSQFEQVVVQWLDGQYGPY